MVPLQTTYPGSLNCCLQLYHPDTIIHYEYGSETISLSQKNRLLRWPWSNRSCHRVVVEFAFLLENGGDKDVETLYAMYPRSLYSDAKNGDGWEIQGVDVVSDFAAVKQLLPRMTGNASGDMPSLTLTAPNPLNPVDDITFGPAPWGGKTDQFVGPELGYVDVDALRRWNCTFMQLRLKVPFKAGERRWFFFVMSHEIDACRCMLGHAIHMHVASPIEVQNSARELLQNARLESNSSVHFKDQLRQMYDRLGTILGVVDEHPLNIGLYEVNLKPETPMKYHMDFFHLERDIYARNDSPQRDPTTGSLTYQFRGGRYLEAARNSSPYNGFCGFFQILCK